MNNLFLAMYVKLQNLMNRDEGQDLVEYALLVCLIALAAISMERYRQVERPAQSISWQSVAAGIRFVWHTKLI